MARTRMVMELGMGTDLQGADYTKAACRAVHNALRQNSLSVYDAFGVSRDSMDVDIIIGVAKPDAVDVDAVAALLPYGKRQVICERGGMDTPKPDGGVTVMANAALIVHLDLPEGKTWGVGHE
ncbi:MAG: Lin0512 family protein [Pseudomonadota bacterium]